MTAEREAKQRGVKRDGSLWLKVDKTLRHYARKGLQATRDLLWNLHPVLAERPIFVVGCSRSGTTLVYRTFSESREIGSLQRETHEFWSRLHPIEQRAWRSHELTVEHASDSNRVAVSRYFHIGTGHRRFVDKNNQNGLAIPYLRALFPDAHFVYIKRGPGDNINSLIEGWRRPEAFGSWSLVLPRSVAIDGGCYKRWCFFLAEGWEEVLRQMEVRHRKRQSAINSAYRKQQLNE